LRLCEAEDFAIDGNTVKQVTCKNGKNFEGDFFIAACDANVLYDRLLKGQYPDPEFQKRFNDPETYPLASNIYVGIGYEGRYGAYTTNP